MVVVRDRALLLQRHAYSESSLVVHACTREHGRVHLIAKGAYRPTSRYFAVLDYFDTLELEWDHNPARELSNLRSGALLVRRRALCTDLAGYRAALSIGELVDLASRPAHAEAALFDLFEDSLARLQERAGLPRTRAELVQVVFELRFLHHLGLSVSLERCAACGGEAALERGSKARAAFSAGAGGRLCTPCAAEARAGGRRVGTMPIGVLDDALRLQCSGDEAGAGFHQVRVDRVRDLVERFLDYHLETRPRTQRAFLSVPNRNADSPRAEAR
jgi:DNA repair protein RecO (recombination protein O)